MNSMFQRAAAAVSTLAIAAMVAVGCGGEGGGGAAAAAGGGLDFVPAEALFFFSLDTNVEGEGWQQAREHAQQFEGYEQQRNRLLTEPFEGCSDDDTNVTWSDVAAWVGATAGGAALPADESAEGTSGERAPASEPDMLLWSEVQDRSAAESFLEQLGYESGDQEGDFTWYRCAATEGDEAAADQGAPSEVDAPDVVALSDELMLAAESEQQLQRALESEGGDTILDDAGVKTAADQVEDDALMAFVLNGSALRDFADQAGGGTSRLADLQGADALRGLSVWVRAIDEGFHASGYAALDEEKLPEGFAGEAFDPALIENLPADTVFALNAQDLGGQIEQAATRASEDNKDVAQGVAQVESVLGMDLEDLAQAWDGQFALAIGEQTGRGQGLAAMVPPIGLIIETSDEEQARTVGEKLLGLSQLQTGTAPEQVTIEGVEAQQATVQGVTLIAGTADGHTIYATSRDFFAELVQDGGLGEQESFQQAWEAADVPDEVNGVFYVDAERALDMARGLGAEVDTADVEALGPWVGWTEVEGDHLTFDVFMQIDETDAADADTMDTTATTETTGTTEG